MSLALVQDDRPLQPDGDDSPAGALWSAGQLRGTLCELSQDGARAATLAFATQLLVQAQRQGDYVAWLSARSDVPYAPDLVACGVDLASMVWVQTASDERSARSAERLLQSGGFGFVVLDCLTPAVGLAQVPMAMQGRLIKLAQLHSAGVLFLSDKSEHVPSLSSMIAVRAVAGWSLQSGRQLQCRLRAIKDKRHGPGWEQTMLCQIPDGWHACDVSPV